MPACSPAPLAPSTTPPPPKPPAMIAGIENELYYKPGTAMLFGDAKTAVQDITAELANV